MMKKQLIMDNALDLFAKNGIKNTSVQQITDSCDMSKGAFYLAFTSKDELIISLIDRFMIQYTSDIDYLVNNVKKEDLLHEFFTDTFAYFLEHDDFATVFLKEQSHQVNEEFLLKVKKYDRKLNESLYVLVSKLYKNKQAHEKHELVYVIKALIEMYRMFSFQSDTKLDTTLFVQSLIDKVEVIAQYGTVSFITEDLFIQLDADAKSIDVDILSDLIDRTMEEVADNIVIESLQILKQQLTKESMSLAIVHGLLYNIQSHLACKEVSYYYRKYVNELF